MSEHRNVLPRRRRFASAFIQPRALATGLGLAVVLGFFSGLAPASSQQGDAAWGEPVNLSRTGGTGNPHLAVTLSGLRHVLWDVTFAESAYSFGDGTQWSRPTSIEVPFVDRPVTLIPGRGGDIHAFWLDQEGSLFHKAVPGNSLSSTGSWFGGRRLATSVAAFAVALDDQNRPHVGLIRAEDTPSLPAGVYYLTSASGGETWSPPRLLYESNYYQRYLPSNDPGGAVADPVDGPAIDVAAETEDNTTWLYLSWDNPPLKRAFQTASGDAGASWSEPVEIDGPSSAEPYGTPHQPQVFALGRSVVRTWKLGSAGGSCRTRSQASADAGKTWRDIQPPFAGLEACPRQLQSFVLEDGRRLFLFEQGGQVYLAAWDGSNWTAAQPQPVLEYFVNPETYDFVQLGCLQAGVTSEKLIVVGCDGGSGGDIWATERALEDVDAWFEAAPSWTTTEVTLEEGVTPSSLAAIGDPEGTTHVMWLEPSSDVADDSLTDVAYVGLKAGESFGPFLILPEESGSLDGLDLALSPEGRLLAVWGDKSSGDIAATWTVADQADAAASWFDPTAVPGKASASRSPSIVGSEGGRLDVLYAVPVNDQRGVYLATSDDFGRTWGEPVQVYDGTKGECEMVDDSHLARTADGRLHALWTCGTQPGGRGPLALWYARSEDSGSTWSPAVTLAEAPASWSDLLALTTGELHLLWEERRSGRTLTFHRTSVDGGETWSTAEALSSSGGEDGATAAVADDGGQIHLLQVAQETDEPVRLRYSMWDGSRWQAGPNLDLAAEEISQVVDLAAASTLGRLVAIVAERSRPNADGTRPYQISMASIAAPAPPRQQATRTPVSPRPTPSAPAVETAQAPTQTPPPPLFSTEVGASGGGLAAGLVAALVSTVILLGVALAYRFRGVEPAPTEPPPDQTE